MTDTIAHKRAVVDAYDEGFQAAHDVAIEALDVAKRLEAENERLRHDLDVARAEVLRLTNPAQLPNDPKPSKGAPLAVGDRVRMWNGTVETIEAVDHSRVNPYLVDGLWFPATTLERLS